MDILIILLVILPIFILIYYYLDKTFAYWSDRGIKGPEPSIPFGNLLQFVRYGQVKLETEWSQRYGPVYGIFAATNPVLTIVDPELIKQVLIKDFHLFVNRDNLKFEHDIWKCNLFGAENDTWKRIRAIASPSFSSGKLKNMQPLMNQCVDKLCDHLNSLAATQANEINIKEVISGFAIDTIASTSFATETDVNRSTEKKNPIVVNGMKLMNFNAIRLTLFFTFPIKFNALIGNPIGLNMKSFNFFVNLSREIIKQRKEQHNQKTGQRNDLVQLMMDAFVYEDELKQSGYESLTALENESTEKTLNHQFSNSSSTKTLTEKEIIAQCILFLIAGFETTSGTISHCLYNLALNTVTQERLNYELNAALSGLEIGSEQYFETIMNSIPYLDAVIKESLRMAPPLARLQRRVSVDDYQLAGIKLDKDLRVDIGVYAVHYSPKYYPDPKCFNPERFMPENKHLLVPYTYLPFGLGPRNCIGMRFAYQEIKLCLARIIREFKFEKIAKTEIPIQYTKMVILTTKNIHLKVTKR